jgi:hypothetical protein
MYQQVLGNYLIPNVTVISGEVYCFPQDGASCHRARSRKELLRQRIVNLLHWPSYSPDMNITANLWGYMTRKVYPNRKQYSTLESLETACRESWKGIDQNYITALFDSMPRRVSELLMLEVGQPILLVPTS